MKVHTRFNYLLYKLSHLQHYFSYLFMPNTPNVSCLIHQQLTIPGQHLHIMWVLSHSSNNQLQQTPKPLKKRGIKLTRLASYSQLFILF